MDTVQQAMERCWVELTRHQPPTTLLIDPRYGELYEVISAEEQALREIPSPAGLRRLFPALPMHT